MREQSTAAAGARIALGGQLAGFGGVLPGVVEECLLTLRARKPLYLVGAFGGAARAVADLLRGEPRADLTSERFAATARKGWTSLVEEYEHAGAHHLRPEQAVEELGQLGSAGLASALANGLSDAENTELLATTDAHRAVRLVIHGLHQVAGPGE
jgi:hypothetical protein